MAAENNQRVAARDWLLPAMQKRIAGLNADEVQARAHKARIPTD